MRKKDVTKTKILLSKAAIDSLVLTSLNANYVDKSGFEEYTTSSGQKIMLYPPHITVRRKCFCF